MEGAISGDVERQLANLKTAVSTLEDRLKPIQDIMAAGPDPEVDPVLEAEMYLVLAESVQSLFQSYLMVQGLPVENSVMTKESERLEQYKKKVSRIGSEMYLKTHRPATQIDIEAANRFISAAIPEQREALRASTKRKHDEQMTDAADQFLEGLLGMPEGYPTGSMGASDTGEKRQKFS